MVRNAIYYFSQKKVILDFRRRKRITFQISMTFQFVKRKFDFKLLMFSSFDELYCSPIFHITQMEHTFQERKKKNIIKLVNLVTGLEPNLEGEGNQGIP